uniref:hypothetical protein n=1 Tax=Ruthenibacterium lactatiformans TaxID=1550024 RepID=UPI0026740613
PLSIIQIVFLSGKSGMGAPAMNRNNLSVGIRLVCFVLSDTIHIKGGPHSWAAFVCLEKQTEIYEKGGME